jgi:hypothetical protein
VGKDNRPVRKEVGHAAGETGQRGPLLSGQARDLLDPARRALVDEIANELDLWPGVRIERRSDGAAVAVYRDSELGLLDRERGVAELGFARLEYDELDRRYREVRGEEYPDGLPDA